MIASRASAGEARPSAATPAARRLRVFYALWPDALLQRRLADLATNTAQDAQGRATRAANLHLTVAFVGEVAPDRLDALCAIGADVAAGGAAFTLALDRRGSFRDSGIAWLAASARPEPLLQLASTLADRLLQAGLVTDRRSFFPHVTLARRCTRAVLAPATVALDWRVDALTLTASTLTPAGPDYRTLARWPLPAAER